MAARCRPRDFPLQFVAVAGSEDRGQGIGRRGGVPGRDLDASRIRKKLQETAFEIFVVNAGERVESGLPAGIDIRWPEENMTVVRIPLIGELASRVPGRCRYCPTLFLIAASICFFTASRLKDAGSCIGG